MSGVSTTTSSVFLLVLAASIVMPVNLARGDNIRFVNGKTAALQIRIDLIQQAERSIDLSYYAIDTDEVPTALLELLRQAACRGVRVRILVDGLKSRLPSRFEHYLRRFGIKVRVYHPPHQGNPSWLNRRLHTKLMVVDSNTAIIGSRNLENEYFHFEEGRNFADCDALIAGQSAVDSQRYFDWLWSSPDVARAPERDSLSLDILNCRPFGRSDWNIAWRDAEGPADFQQLLTQALKRVLCRCNVQIDTGTDWLPGTIADVPVRLLHDRSSDKSERHVQKSIIRMMDSDLEKLWIIAEPKKIQDVHRKHKSVVPPNPRDRCLLFAILVASSKFRIRVSSSFMSEIAA